MEKYFKKTFLTLSISYILLLLFSSILNLQKMPPLELYSLENILMIGFILMVWGCLNVNISRVKTYVFLYQLIISLSLYVFYNLYYGTGLGYNPADTYTYNKLATLGSQMNLSDYLVMLENRGYAYSDWGFMVFGKYVYSLPGNGLFNMKIINLLFHYSTSVALYKLSLLITNKEVSKYIFIIYGLNPISTYFCSSGLKEIIFIFCVMWAFYWFYKFIVYKSLRYLTISILISILIIFFRPLVFLCFLGSIVVHFYVNYRSKYPILYNIIMLIILILLAYFVYNMLQDEIDNYLTINIEAGDEEKLQSTSTEIEIGTFKIINIFVGLFGPFPTYMQLGGKDIEIIQSPGIYLKSFLSIFFCFFCSFIVLKKHFKYLPLVAFCFFNIIVLIVSSFTFDIRFHYPYLPMFIFSAIVGIDLIERKHLWWLINTYFAVLIIVIFIWNRRL